MNCHIGKLNRLITSAIIALAAMPLSAVADDNVKFQRPQEWSQTPRMTAYLEKEDVRVPENRVIYEIFVRNFSPEGTLKGVEKQISRLKSLGVDVIWLMPIYTPGNEGRWGPYSSPYAVKNYKGIDPLYGTDADLHSLVKAIHDAGMEIWLDWVANHTAIDHPWVKEHIDYYASKDGNRPYHPHGWNDVYQLDFSNGNLRRDMIDAMKYWVREFDIDGFRCDYVEGVPRDFWKEARTEVDKVKPVAWLAESGGDGEHAKLISEGIFDYNYAWAFRDRLAEFANNGNVTELKKLCNDLFYNDNYKGRSRMVYLTNHDVVQDKGGTEDRVLGQRLWPLTVLEFTIYGMPLLYNGQEIKYSHDRVSLAEKTPIDWSRVDQRMASLISTLISLKHTEPALRTGSQCGRLISYDTSDGDIYAYERRLDDESVVVMLNFSGNAKTFTVKGSLPDKVYVDVFSGNSLNLSRTKSFNLPAYGYAVFIK